MESHVLRFLSGHRDCWVRGKSTGPMPLTHTFLDGQGTGKLSVPDALRTEFMNAVADDLAAGTLPSLNELRAKDVFVMYADLDIHCAPASAPDAGDVGKICVAQIARFFDTPPPFRCVVLVTPDRPKDDGASDAAAVIKRGVHLHFPGICVTIHEALLMREAMTEALARSFPAIDWPEDFDNRVYENDTGGLRMVGAPKARACAECKGRLRERDVCVVPGCRKGKITLPTQRYSLLCVLDASTADVDQVATQLLTVNPGQLARNCSIYSFNTAVTTGWREFPGCPSYSALRQRDRREPCVGKKRRSFPDERVSMQREKWPANALVTDTTVCAKLTRLFRMRFSPVYANVKLSPIKYSPRLKQYYVQFSGEGESWCLNKNGRHGGNRMYGIVTSTLATLKCHCSKSVVEGRVYGIACSAFKLERRLGASDHATLFPSAAPTASKPRTDVDYLRYLHGQAKQFTPQTRTAEAVRCSERSDETQCIHRPQEASDMESEESSCLT